MRKKDENNLPTGVYENVCVCDEEEVIHESLSHSKKCTKLYLLCVYLPISL